MKLRRVAFCALVLAFVLAHTQAPLYFSNQHQYMLHGLAQAGEGHLSEDWLANTTDPTPFFSMFVRVTHRFLNDGMFHVYFALAIAIYFVALVAVFQYVAQRKWSDPSGLFFIACIIAIHAGVLRYASAHELGKDYPWFLQSGVAGQYVLGPGLQPSVSGVLLIAAFPAFLSGGSRLAVLLAWAASTIHTTYLPASGMFVAAILWVMWRRGERQQAVWLGVEALLLATVVAIMAGIAFRPTSSEVFQEAQRILARERIPHHAQPRRWFDLIAAMQVGWMILGVIAARERTLRILMSVPLLLGVVFTLIQVATDNDFQALLFPWRISAVLMPIATAVIFSWVISRAGRVFDARRWAPLAGLEDSTRPTKLVLILSLIVIIALAMGGVIIMAGRFAYRMAPEELPLLEHIRLHKKPGEVYLLPVQVPKPASGATGVVSTSFTPPPKRGPDQKLIAVDLQRFRLHTGAALFVDFKSIPYRDVDVVAWWGRVQICQQLYSSQDWNREEVRATLTRYAITHVVAPAARPMRGDYFVKEFFDEHYVLYKVNLYSGKQ